MSRFLNTAGEIDEALVSVAIARKADEMSRRRGVAIEACAAEASAWARRIAEDERKSWIADRQDDAWAAAAAFVAGALDALTPPRTSYQIEAVEGPGIHTFERQQIAQRAIGRIIEQDRRDTFARCLASLDRSLARIAASNDITRYLQAAE